jgi:hypothetical protein
MQVAVLGLQTSFGPAFFLPQRVRCSIQSDPRLTQLLGIDWSDRILHVDSSLIHKGMIITRHYRIRKVAPWAIVQFAWTQLIAHPRMHQANQVGEAHVRAHHIVLHHALTYLCVFFYSFDRLIL